MASRSRMKRAFKGSIESLRTFAESHAPEPELLQNLVGGIAEKEESDQVAASWLLKAYLEKGATLDRALVADLLRSLGKVTAWDARLHVCQCVRFMDVPRRNASQLARFLREQLEVDIPFIRAWACDAFHRLAVQHDEHRAEADAALERGSRDAAASVRARVRNIAKEIERERRRR